MVHFLVGDVINPRVLGRLANRERTDHVDRNEREQLRYLIPSHNISGRVLKPLLGNEPNR
jgi:hypothetical protein